MRLISIHATELISNCSEFIKEAETNWRQLENVKGQIDEELNSTRAQKEDLVHQVKLNPA